MKRYIKAETLNDKIYLFRGVSSNKYQSNYSRKSNLRFKSRYYAYELFEGIQGFGNIAVYELEPSAKLWHYEDSVEEFIDEYNLATYEVPELYQVYKINSLSELQEYDGDKKFDYHDLYHARQIVAMAYLEDNMANQYDGIIWYEWADEPNYQPMIWNNSVVRRLSYQEAKEVLLAMEQLHHDLGIEDSMYYKDEFDGKYYYNIAKKNQGNY